LTTFANVQMDPLSLAAKTAGLLTIAANVLQEGYTIVQLIREFRKDILTLTEEVAQLVGIIHALLPSVAEFDTPSKNHVAGNSGNCSESDPSKPTSVDTNRENGVVRGQRALDQTSHQLIIEIRSCQQTLTEVKSLLARFAPTRGERFGNAAKQLQWSLKRSDIERLRKSLAKHKNNFNFILSAHGTYDPV
jgi:hypothetical protein